MNSLGERSSICPCRSIAKDCLTGLRLEREVMWVNKFEGWLDKGVLENREPRIESHELRIESRESRGMCQSRVENREARTVNRESRIEDIRIQYVSRIEDRE